MGSSPSKAKNEIKKEESPPPSKENENFYKNRDPNFDPSKFQYIHYNDYPKGEQIQNHYQSTPQQIPQSHQQFSPPPSYSKENQNFYKNPEYPPPPYSNSNQNNIISNEQNEYRNPQSSRSYYPSVIRHAPIIRREPYYNEVGMGTRTIIEEPFEIEQPPTVQKVKSIVHQKRIYYPPPREEIIEEEVEVPVTVHPPPRREIVREVYEKPILIEQPPESRIVRTFYKKPVRVKPPPDIHIVHDIYEKPIIIPQPPRKVMVQREYEEPIKYLD